MNCENFREVVYEFAAGELPEGMNAVLTEHMEKCGACRKEYEQCLELVQSLKSLGEVEAPSDLLDNVMSEIAKAETKKKLLPKFNNIVKFGSAVAAAIVIFSGMVAISPVLKQNMMPNDEAIENDTTEDTVVSNEAVSGENMYDEILSDALDNVEKTEVTGDNDGEEAVVSNLPVQAQYADNETNKIRKADTAEAGNGIAVQSEVKSSAEIAPYSLGESQIEDSGFFAGARSGGASYKESEKTYVKKIAEFSVPAEYAAVAAIVETEDRTIVQVEDQLRILGIPYEMNITEIDYNSEYEAASDERRAEIAKLCEKETCILNVESDKNGNNNSQ